MRLRLLATGLAAAALGSLAVPTHADPLYFERECSKLVDSRCYNDFCGIYYCIRTDCLVYSNAFGEGNAAICVGKARPRDPSA